MTDYRTTVLLVDDDVLIRLALADAFDDRGWDVFEASSALEAIAALSGSARITAMVTDVDMPGPLNGLHLATMAAKLFPDMPIAVSSGRHENAAQTPEGAVFFPKPTRPEEVAQHFAVRRSIAYSTQ